MKLIVICLISLSLIACNESFLDRFPETSISQETYFRDAKDLELYTNTFYEYVLPSYQDGVTDNVSVYATVSETVNLLKGNISPGTVGAWGPWERLRRINFFINRAHSATGDPELINHHVGLAKLMRAIFYYGLIKRYSDVPWYSRDLTDTDDDLLYKVQDSRSLVVDSVIRDLAFAVEHIKADMGNKTRINKWYAYSTMARICLHEGTFRKYHDELGLAGSADVFLNQAVAASLKVMESGLFSIDSRGGFGSAYQNLFINTDLSTSPEIILFKDYSATENLRHSASAEFDFVFSLSRSLMESYEVLKDGMSYPFTSVAGYESTSFVDAFKNRDPRLSQTFMRPGYVKPGQASPYRANLNLGGYPHVKFVPQTSDQVAHNSNYTDLPIARLAEIYLIYAEAKAELGSLTQNDLDISVNRIRARVGMPQIFLAQIAHNPVLSSQYPNVNGPNANQILELRRERRIELAMEGLRYDDLMRWGVGERLAGPHQGVYLDRLGLHDVTGDGVPDIGVYRNQASNDVPTAERNRYVFFYLENNDGSDGSIYLSGGDFGYIMDTGDRNNPRAFISPRYYYFPIAQGQMILNPNLRQTNFW